MLHTLCYRCRHRRNQVVTSQKYPVEVDENGNLYVTAQANVYSYLPSGELRWRQPLDENMDGEDPEFRSLASTSHQVALSQR